VKKKILLITGSSGLVGSEAVTLLHKDYDLVYGIDNNQRKIFFGKKGDIIQRQNEVIKNVKNYRHLNFDIRNKKKIFEIFKKLKPEHIIHCAGQPSHDLAAQIPFEDFSINAVSTLNLLEAVRVHSPKSIFVFLSTNKVYGDGPNFLKIQEMKSRYIFVEKKYKQGISEDFKLDQCTHSLFGASKLSADIMVQEYGRYFNIYTCCLRAGCITGHNHSGVELHGFLNYLVKTNLEKKKYKIYGYKGKQVRDNIHSTDLVNFIKYYLAKPRFAEVYNIGGGFENTISVIEAIKQVSNLSGIEMKYDYINKPRIGDHICYYSNLSKIKSHFPKWKIKLKIPNILGEIIKNYKQKKTWQ
jgi:CDP-paratose 2-epimerase